MPFVAKQCNIWGEYTPGSKGFLNVGKSRIQQNSKSFSQNTLQQDVETPSDAEAPAAQAAPVAPVDAPPAAPAVFDPAYAAVVDDIFGAGAEPAEVEADLRPE